jgi:membrane protein DedA with SNARE-associated domain
VNAVLDQLLHVPPAAVLAIVGALVFGEAAVFLGFVIPGETAVLLGGFLASTGRLSVVVLGIVVVLAAVIGDSVGYEVGRKFGPRMLRWRMFRRHEERIERARGFLDGRGGSAVLIGRGTAFLRAVTPGLAGLSGMQYRRFLAWNALGGVIWGVGCVVAGYLAGDSYKQVASYLGKAGAAVIVLIIVAALVAWRVRRRRTHPEASSSVAEGETAPHDTVGS